MSVVGATKPCASNWSGAILAVAALASPAMLPSSIAPAAMALMVVVRFIGAPMIRGGWWRLPPWCPARGTALGTSRNH
jgi:hypothetical protein